MNLSRIRFNFILYFIFPLAFGFNVDVRNAKFITGITSSGSYFGYSVALAKTNRENWILVGAPRGMDPKMPSVNRPGAVYRCRLIDGGAPNCDLLDIDHNVGSETAQFNGKSVSFVNGREDSFLGGSIAVGHQPSSDFIACAPKWYDIYNVENYYMNGMCYRIPLDFEMRNAQKTPVFVGHHITKLVGGRYVWDYAFSGLGMSAHYTQAQIDEGEHVLIGSPGLLDWIGGFVDISVGSVKIMKNDINTTEITRPYIGSALSSGRYFSDGLTYIASGSPREDLTGLVVFFRLNDPTFVYQKPALVLSGKDEKNKDLPLNAYFGATLCTVDVNKDGADDLLVGAPLYSSQTNGVFNEHIDMGLVFVHMGSKQLRQFKNPPQMLKGVEPFGRFGTAIESLGDINGDSFPDVAIGAPYENNNKGALYIFNGYTDGLWPVYSQRILATDLHTGTSGFGIAISSGMNLNNDAINDVVIGSYLSDEVIVLFGQPIVTLDAELNILDKNNVETDFVEVNEEDKYVKVCVRFSDRACNHVDLDVTTELDLNQKHSRLKFAVNNQRKVTKRLRLFNDILGCTTSYKIVAVPTVDYVSDIVVRTNYSVAAFECPGYEITPTASLFDGNNPKDPKLTLQKELYFRKDCPNNICNTNLTLKAKAVYESVDGNFLIVKQALIFDINITKTGDPSYGSIFEMVYPSFLSFTKTEKVFGESDVICSVLDARNETDTDLQMEDHQRGLECSFGNPMRHDVGVNFQLFMQIPPTVTETSMKITMSATTLSNEQDPSDNYREIDINMKYNVEASFTGKAAPDTIYIEGESKSSNDMNHIYELINRGPSTLVEAYMNISYPIYLVDDEHLMYLNATKVNCDKPCEVECSIRNTESSPPVYQYFNDRLVSVAKRYQGDLDTVQMSNCTSEKCPMLQCTAHLIQAHKSAVVYLNFIVEKDIKKYFANDGMISFVTHASVQINETNLISSRTGFKHQLATRVRENAVAKKELQWWIILVSCLGGLFLILIIVLILWKVGFFKRKKRDQIREMRKSRALSTKNIQPTKKRKDSYTDSEGGIIDAEVPPAQS